MKPRDAVEEDLPDLLAIYNDVIASSTAIFTENALSPGDFRDWWLARVTKSHPILVLQDEAGIAGFASFTDFRAWPGYRYTVEHSVHVRADARGRGIGDSLMRALIPRATALGKHMMVAGIDAANTGSIRFHERLGFTEAGRLSEVGWKFGRYLDLVFMQRRLG